jgi:hypothetical protein
MAELATRYNSASSLMYSQFTPFQNRLLAVRIFEKLGSIKDAALEKCRKKRASKYIQLYIMKLFLLYVGTCSNQQFS